MCQCNVVRADEIRSEVRLGATTVAEVALRCGASNRCGGCGPAVELIVADELQRARSAVPARD